MHDQCFQELLGEEEYDKVLGRVNAELPDSQKVFRPVFFATSYNALENESR